jgi:hypothetical protein
MNANSAAKPSPLQKLREWMDPANPPDLGPARREDTRDEAVVNAHCHASLRDAALDHDSLALARGALLLWHDHLDAAHRIAQEIETAEGSWLHGIMHRREPDYGNAAYWYRRVGKARAFAELARRAEALIASAGDADLKSKILRGGAWDAFAFIDACEAAARRPATPARVELLKRLQALEFDVFLESLAARAGGDATR